MFEFIEKTWTGRYRNYAPNDLLIPVFQREYYCVDKFGMSGTLWFTEKYHYE